MITNGIDIIKIEKFKDYVENDNIMNSIFTNKEIDYFKKRNFSLDSIAGTFAAKEATLKSLGKGLDGYPLKEIEILHDGYKPFLNFLGETKKEIEKINLSFSISISHDGEYAIASVIAYSI